MSWEAELELATHAATAAASYLQAKGASVASGSGSGWRDIKLDVDKEAEDIILQALAARSDYSILAEESGGNDLGTADGPYWIVDPLDGSLNYHRGIPFYCVSIALWQRRAPLLGVVLDVRSEDLYTAVVGRGARCNREAINVSVETDPKQAVVATGFPVGRSFEAGSVGRFVEQVRSFKKVRLFGSAALSLAYVACGRVDAYIEEGIMLWDVAAGIALVEASGGQVGVRDAPNREWARDVVVAATPELVAVLSREDVS